MKFLLDVNMSRLWVDVLKSHGHDVIRWQDIGDPTEIDEQIMAWARDHDHIVLTCDLDFGDILAATNAAKPSVIQFRLGRLKPHSLVVKLEVALRTYRKTLQEGALITLDPSSSRVQRLPMNLEF
jgi:predicted nuclease of predicted toxin-antitoxin system